MFVGLLSSACGRLGYAPSDAMVVTDLDAGVVDAPLLDAPGDDAPAIDAADLDAVAIDAAGLDAVAPDAVGPDAPLDAPSLLPDAPSPDAASADAFVPTGTLDPRCVATGLDHYADIGTGTSSDPYVLCNEAQFESYEAAGPSTAYYALGRPITVGSWAGRASLVGGFDGRGHLLRVTAFVTSPLILSLVGEVEDLELEVDVDAQFLDRVGAIAGTSSGRVRDVSLRANFVSGQDETGGLVGHCAGCTIEDVSVDVSRISGLQMVGGIVGNMFAGSLEGARASVTQLDARTTTGCAVLGGIAGTAHDGATIDEAHAIVGIAVNAGGAGGIVGTLGLGSSARDVIAEGDVTYLGGATCTTGVGGLAGDLSGTLREGWARLDGATAGIADRVQLGARLEDVASITPGLGSPEWVLRSCALGSMISDLAVLDHGAAGSGSLVCAFEMPRVTTDPRYFFSASNLPMSSWDRTTWRFADAEMPALVRVARP